MNDRFQKAFDRILKSEDKEMIALAKKLWPSKVITHHSTPTLPAHHVKARSYGRMSELSYPTKTCSQCGASIDTEHPLRKQHKVGCFSGLGYPIRITKYV